MYSSYSSPNSCNNNKLQCTLCAQKTMLFGSHLCRRSWVCRGWWTRTPPWKWVLSISKRPLKAVLRIRSKLTWIRIRLQDLKKPLRTLSKVIPIQSRRIFLSPDKPKPRGIVCFMSVRHIRNTNPQYYLTTDSPHFAPSRMRIGVRSELTSYNAILLFSSKCRVTDFNITTEIRF